MSTASPETVPSAFYFACRNGEISAVEQFLRQLNPDEINKIQPNGSTALHAACYYGHTKIVRMLLDITGIKRQQKNCFDKTPVEEATNEEIRRMLNRYGNVPDS
jgi:ankyrin repeat protein